MTEEKHLTGRLMVAEMVVKDLRFIWVRGRMIGIHFIFIALRLICVTIVLQMSGRCAACGYDRLNPVSK